jgi:hypothetical protein
MKGEGNGGLLNNRDVYEEHRERTEGGGREGTRGGRKTVNSYA